MMTGHQNIDPVESVAYHEAGHCVYFWKVCGVKVDHIEMRLTPDDMVAGTCMPLGGRVWPESVKDFGALVAGSLAVEALEGRGLWSLERLLPPQGVDAALVRAALEVAGHRVPSAATDAVLHKVIDLTRLTLQPPARIWKDVERVAEKLLASRKSATVWRVEIGALSRVLGW